MAKAKRVNIRRQRYVGPFGSEVEVRYPAKWGAEEIRAFAPLAQIALASKEVVFRRLAIGAQTANGASARGTSRIPRWLSIFNFTNNAKPGDGHVISGGMWSGLVARVQSKGTVEVTFTGRTPNGKMALARRARKEGNNNNNNLADRLREMAGNGQRITLDWQSWMGDSGAGLPTYPNAAKAAHAQKFSSTPILDLSQGEVAAIVSHVQETFTDAIPLETTASRANKGDSGMRLELARQRL